MRAKYMLIALLIFLAGCTNTHVTSSWRAKDSTTRPYEKILVIGIMGDSIRDMRQNMEAYLVKDLKANGIHAISAFDEYGPQAFKKMTEDQVTERIKNRGYDGVLTITLINKKKQKYFVPGSWEYPALSSNYGFFWGYYSFMWGEVYDPGYYETTTTYLWESNLYNLITGKLVYSVQSKSFNPVDARSLGQVYGKRIVQDILKTKVIEAQIKK